MGNVINTVGDAAETTGRIQNTVGCYVFFPFLLIGSIVGAVILLIQYFREKKKKKDDDDDDMTKWMYLGFSLFCVLLICVASGGIAYTCIAKDNSVLNTMDGTKTMVSWFRDLFKPNNNDD